MHDNAWQEKSACKDLPIDIFFPDYYQGQSKGAKRRLDAEAKAICATCPVRLECLEYALRYAPDGIWGGLNELERRQWLRKWRRGWQS